MLKSGTCKGEDEVRHCKRCDQNVHHDDFLQCSECNNLVHIKCLQQKCTPGDLIGDVFFDYTCAKCCKETSDRPSTSWTVNKGISQEKIIRQRLPWVIVISLVLHNLSIKSKGLSRQGFFHWRSHIAAFIDRNWKYLFPPDLKRPKNILGSISSNLSINSPTVFESGQLIFSETGWWKLTGTNITPLYVYRNYDQLKAGRRQEQQRGENKLTQMSTAQSEDDSDAGNSCSRTIPYMGRQPRQAKNAQTNRTVDEQPQSPNLVQSSLMDFLAESFGNDDMDLFNNIPEPEPIMEDSKKDLLQLLDSPNESFNEGSNLENMLKTDYHEQLSLEPPIRSGIEAADTGSVTPSDTDDEDGDDGPRIVQVINFQHKEQSEKEATKLSRQNKEHQKVAELKTEEVASKKSRLETNANNESTCTEVPLVCEKSRFTKSVPREWPWTVERREYLKEEFPDMYNGMQSSKLSMMSLYEEKEMLLKLRKVMKAESKVSLEIPTHIRRFYRKLCIRESNRQHNRPVFNIDCLDKPVDKRDEERLIDRYQLITGTSIVANKSFYARLAGCMDYEMFSSPYSQRILHPFIYRNKEMLPPWLKLMCELQYTVNGTTALRAPIDFCYVRPNHIAPVNALLQMLFWPGIDMTECLNYPDFSVVALYKKLVIGCGFLIPDVTYNEAYISFMAVRPGWQRSGIATFMLYHLIQTCMSKDITLHVSATNPAILLYQKFGFKIEEVILNFYDKYLPIDSPHSRNAFFLRLIR